MSDSLGRPILAEGMKRIIDDALKTLDPEAKAALLVIGDEKNARVHFAARLPEGWRVAAGAGWAFEGERKASGWLGIEKVWK
jgi:hypothetical protein